MRKTIQAKNIFTILLLLGLIFHSWQNTTGQTPRPETKPDPRDAAAKVMGEAIQLFVEHTTESMEKAVEIAEKARKMYNELGEAKDEGMAYMMIGHINKALDNKRLALKSYQQALPLFQQDKDREMEALARSNIGAIYADLGEHEKALDAYNQALPVMREVKNRAGEAEILYYMGTVYEERGEKQKALEYYRQALPIYRELKNREMEAQTLRKIGRLQAELGEKQKALENLNQASTIFRGLGKKEDEVLALASTGEVYMALNEPRKALEAYKLMLAITKETGKKDEEATILYNLGMASFELGDKQTALDYFNQGRTLYKTLGDKEGEAAALDTLARFYENSNDKQKALDYYNQSLTLYREAGNRGEEALALLYIGKLYEDLRNWQKALVNYNEALLIYKELGDKKSEALALHRIGSVYSDLSEMDKALAFYNQALTLRRLIGYKKGEALTLAQIGDVYNDLGDKQKALEYLGQALQLQRTLGEKPEEIGTTLQSIGLVYDTMGEKQKALEYFQQTLALNRPIKSDGIKEGEAFILNSIGRMYGDLGEMEKALEYLNKALSIHRTQRTKVGEAATLNNIGMVYLDLGERAKALDYIIPALKLFRELEDKQGEAAILANLAITYAYMDEYGKGLEYAEQALRLSRITGDKALEGRTLSNIGKIYLNLGQKQKALEYLTQALPIRRQVEDKPGEAMTLMGIAEIYHNSKEPLKALEYLYPALLLARVSKDTIGEAIILSDLAAVWADLNNPRLAIFFGKESVIRYQELRGAIRGIDRQNQQTFLRSIELPFRRLSGRLLEEGRLTEAHQILNLFKDQEFFDAIQPGASSAPQTRSPELTQRELEAAAIYQEATTRLATVNSRLLELELSLKGRKPTSDDERQLEQLRAQYKAAGDETLLALKKIEASFKQPADGQDKLAMTSDTVEMQTALKELSEKTNSPAVAIYTLTGDEKFYVLLVTHDQLIPISSQVSALELMGGVIGDRRIKKDGLLKLLESPKYDPRPRAKELYNIIFKPIEPEIERIEATARKQNPDAAVILMWSLDWALRYIPMAVLYDGKHYLAERYRNVVFTRANKERMTRPVSQNWVGIGFGSTKPQTVKVFGEEKFYEALPGAEKELATIFGSRQKRGILPGQTWLNEEFTKDAFLDALKQKKPLVHLASHFTFQPGDEAHSFLLMGKDELMTLEELKAKEGLFTGVELLTLSACNTGSQQSGANGREIDGFAELAQRLGASAVLATLWPVSDASTPLLIGEFYRLRQEKQGMTKAEALRQAQLALLRGSMKVEPAIIVEEKQLTQQKSGRTDIVGLKEEPINATKYQPDPKAPFAHPYYWSAFVLIGNYR